MMKVLERIELGESKHTLSLIRSGKGFSIEIQTKNEADYNERGFCYGACSRRFDEATARDYLNRCARAFKLGLYTWNERKAIVQNLGGVLDTFAHNWDFSTDFAKKVRADLLRLAKARENIYSREGYDKACIALECAEFPYRLCQYDRDEITNKVFRNYRYGWKTINWDGDASVYIEETDACKKPVGGIREALDMIERVLLSYLTEKEAA